MSGDFANGITGGWNFDARSAAVKPDPVTGNYSIWLDCAVGCSAPGLFQDFRLEETMAAYGAAAASPTGNYSLQGGVTLSAQPRTPVNIIVHLWGPDNQYYGPHGVIATMAPSDVGPRPLRYRILWNQSAKPLVRARLEISSTQQSSQIGIDNVFLAVLPAGAFGAPTNATTVADIQENP